jgi:hypothetical protein
MTQEEALAGWRLFSFSWIPVGLMALALALGLALTGFSIKPTSALLPFGVAAAYMGVTYYKTCQPCKPDPMVVFILGSTGQIVLIPALITPLTYIAAAADFPMQDANLAALDRALGLDWSAYFSFVYGCPALLSGLVFAYNTIGLFAFGVPVVLGAARRYRRLQEFILAFALALLATTVISTLVPAIGVYDQIGLKLSDYPNFTPGAYLGQLHDLPLVRDGSLRELDMLKLTGIITFPSFHSAAAVLYLWALWSVWWMRPIVLVANGAMLLATPLGGGHYFVDVFAGMVIAVLAIAAARQISWWLTARPAQLVATPYAPEAAVAAE